MSLSEEAGVTPEYNQFPLSWFLDINPSGGGDNRPPSNPRVWVVGRIAAAKLEARRCVFLLSATWCSLVDRVD